jgi:hypothetical protein
MNTDLKVLNADSKKRKCVECGKDLRFFEGYRHPTLGVHYLLCQGCFEKVEGSVERWGRFVLWNSFNPESPDPRLMDNLPFLHENNMMRHKKTKLHRHFHQ